MPLAFENAIPRFAHVTRRKLFFTIGNIYLIKKRDAVKKIISFRAESNQKDKF
jgi:hypothetical protein